MINNVVSLMEYSIALELDGNSAEAHLGTGKVLLAKKDFANAVSELKQAADLGPSVAANHDLYAQALQATGKTDSAIAEFRQAFSLDPKQLQVQLELASALEKKRAIGFLRWINTSKPHSPTPLSTSTRRSFAPMSATRRRHTTMVKTASGASRLTEGCRKVCGSS